MGETGLEGALEAVPTGTATTGEPAATVGKGATGATLAAFAAGTLWTATGATGATTGADTTGATGATTGADTTGTGLPVATTGGAGAAEVAGAAEYIGWLRVQGQSVIVKVVA